MSLLYFLLAHQKNVLLSINTLKFVISTFGVQQSEKDVLSSSSSYDRANNLLALLNVG